MKRERRKFTFNLNLLARFESVYFKIIKFLSSTIEISQITEKKKRSHSAAFFVKNMHAAYLRSITLRV